MEREKEADREESMEKKEEKKERNLFMKDGKPFNINDGKLGFTLDDRR